MKKYFVLLGLLSFVFCGSDSKTVTPDALPQKHEHQNNQKEHAHQELHVSADKQQEWGIVVGSLSQQSVSSQITLPGILTVNQNRTAHISSFIEGKVISHPADLGDKVQKGQVLATINSPSFAQAQADFLQARAKFLLSQKEYQRAKRLLAEKAIEEKEYLRRQTEHEKLATEYGSLGSALHSYGITHKQIDELIQKCQSLEDKDYKCEIADPYLPLLSPISGTVIFRDIVIGEHVESDKVLYTVSGLETLWALLDAYEKDLPLINKESIVTITSSLYPNERFTGKTTYISDIIDKRLRTIKIRVEVKNQEGLLKPNMYIQGMIENQEKRPNILTIPDDAIQNLDGKKIVFVLEKGSVFAVRPIELGRKVGEKRIVTKGLERNDRIVLKGAFHIKAELSKETFGHAHVH